MIFFSRAARADAQIQLAAQRLSTRLAFFSLGFATAAWAPLIPFAQQRLHLNHADFGLLLLCSGLGAILAMPTTGLLIYRLGCKVLISIALLMLLLLLPALALGSTALSMAVILFLFGTAAGSLGVTVNFQAVFVEKSSDRPMMSSFHGMCSLGGLLGVMSMTVLLTLGVSAVVSIFMISLILIVMSVFTVPYALSTMPKNTITKETGCDVSTSDIEKKRPSLLILLIGMICFISFLSEGAAMDWSGIYLTSHFGMNAAYAGLGYTFFAIAMTSGRLVGQKALKILGEQKLIQYSVICAFIGLMSIVLAPQWIFVLIGYALLGLGSANIVPIMFSRVGRQNHMQKAAALSCVSTIAYTGSLTGPALIGIIGEYTGLQLVFTGLAVLVGSILALNHFSQLKTQD
ncbi:MFS transporter [Acinetobacter sp. S40]|uniref:MFS transporter n=1 Tax=Acinetobacter sp. S40 TaxID=2767434 RepID=UPI0019096713|nr:MFS transporter [Acinetobacter sp. S40]MBJ9985711.1 MFS transporter [Acinetobacter sp. S40]